MVRRRELVGGLVVEAPKVAELDGAGVVVVAEDGDAGVVVGGGDPDGRVLLDRHVEFRDARALAHGVDHDVQLAERILGCPVDGSSREETRTSSPGFTPSSLASSRLLNQRLPLKTSWL